MSDKTAPTSAAPITGTAAGVPFTALPPTVPVTEPAPLLVTWHMMDAPRTNAAFAAALPLSRLPAWRVHLGLPWCGARDFPGGRAEATADPMLRYLEPVVRQAAQEFPAALAELRDRLPVDDGPINIVGASLGGAVALSVLTELQIPIDRAILINAAIRARSVVALLADLSGTPYSWSEPSRTAADRLDFVARAGEIAVRRPQVLVVSGELDHPAFRVDASDLFRALQAAGEPDDVELITIPSLAHPLAAEPGLEPAPQLPQARQVDATICAWLLSRGKAAFRLTTEDGESHHPR